MQNKSGKDQNRGLAKIFSNIAKTWASESLIQVDRKSLRLEKSKLKETRKSMEAQSQSGSFDLAVIRKRIENGPAPQELSLRERDRQAMKRWFGVTKPGQIDEEDLQQRFAQSQSNSWMRQMHVDIETEFASEIAEIGETRQNLQELYQTNHLDPKYALLQCDQQVTDTQFDLDSENNWHKTDSVEKIIKGQDLELIWEERSECPPMEPMPDIPELEELLARLQTLEAEEQITETKIIETNVVPLLSHKTHKSTGRTRPKRIKLN